MSNSGHIPVVRLKRLQKIRSEAPVILRDVVRSYPAAATVRVFVPPTPEVFVTFLSPRQMILARIVALLLVPAMLFHSVPRAYADEIVGTPDASTTAPVAPAPETPPRETPSTSDEQTPVTTTADSESTTSAAPVTSVPGIPSQETVSASDEQTPTAAPVDSGSTTSTDPASTVDTTAQSPEPATASSALVLGAATDTPLLPPVSPETVAGETSTATVTPESPERTEASGTQATTASPGIIERIANAVGFGGQDTPTTTGENMETVAAPTSTEAAPIPDVNAAMTESTTSLPATTTDETSSTTDEQVVPPLPAGPSAEDVAAKAAQHEEELRQELRKQVEDEFMRGCISFESSGYYCLNTNAAQSGAPAPVKVVTTVESAQGEGGNKEIFVVKNGERTALTSTSFDNAFPSQDISGEQFVWQGMKGGRWQIFYGTLSATGTPVVTQVTDSHDSNFNPKIDGDHVVWQGWVDNNWEIFLATKRDANSPFAGEHLPEGNVLLGVGPEWSVERLTTNTTQDMFPALHGDIITWQSREGGNWVVYAYSIETKNQTKLSADGAKSENPSFAITWEERDEHGGVRLMSYDMSTGKKTDLTDEAKKVSNNPFREKFPAPISQPNQAALPGMATSTATSTNARGDDDSGGSNDLVPS